MVARDNRENRDGVNAVRSGCGDSSRDPAHGVFTMSIESDISATL
jgi:hypothetical protein